MGYVLGIRATRGTEEGRSGEIAHELGVSIEEGRLKLRELMDLGIPGIWLAQNTDYIQSFAPLSNLPTQYRISVEGEATCYGQ